jgi:hypothetical protein
VERVGSGYAVPPIPKGAELQSLIGRRWQMLLMHERELLEHTPRNGIWLPRLQRERQAELGEFAGPHVGRYNVVGWRVWWRRRRAPGARLRAAAGAPPSYQRTLCADTDDVTELVLGRAFRGVLRALPTTSAAHHGVVIRDVGWSSSVPPRREKKEEPEEEWEQIPPEHLEETWPWWVEDREMLAKLSRHQQHWRAAVRVRV